MILKIIDWDGPIRKAERDLREYEIRKIVREEINALRSNDSDSWYGSFTKHTSSDNSGKEG